MRKSGRLLVKRSHSDFADELWLNFETLNVTGEADYPVVIKIGTGKYVRYREILGHPISISGIFHYYPLPVGRRALELCGLFSGFNWVGSYLSVSFPLLIGCDEPETLSYQIILFGPISADAFRTTIKMSEYPKSLAQFQKS